MNHWYKLTCPVCSHVIEGRGTKKKGANGKEVDRTYEVISEGDARLCRWDDIPQLLWTQIEFHIWDANCWNRQKKRHLELVLNPDVTTRWTCINPEQTEEIKKEGSRLVTRSTSQKSLDQCPVTALHILNLSYMRTRWSPPLSDFSATEILRVKKHLEVWGAVCVQKVRNGKS